MAVEYENEPCMRIVHETIYRYIYGKGQKEKVLWELLPRKQKTRRKWKGRRVHRGHIPQRVSIHKRPIEINERLEKGHWEGDTVEGKGHRDGIHTEVERLSRYFMATKIPSISSAATISAQWQLFSMLPASMKLSTTLDNGKENHLHYLLYEIAMLTYFCDPYSSWQKGCNENHNGLLRRYAPKKTDFATLSEQELQDIVCEINHRPRKILGYRTPHEVFTALSLSDQPIISFTSIRCSDSN
jgi:IS30 family transposase